MKNEYQKIMEEINDTAQIAISADAEEIRREQDARKRYEAAQDEMQAALDAGDREKYKAAGMTAESARLDLEFFERMKQKRKAGANRADDARIHAALRSQAFEIKTDALAQLRQIFTEAADVCSAALDQLSEIDKASARWDSAVMKKRAQEQIVSTEDRLILAQILNNSNAQLHRFALRGV